MCDNTPIEESFKRLIKDEIVAIETNGNNLNTFFIFPPLPAKLRFLLHDVLQNHPALQTVSVGVEPNRQLVIFKSDKPVSIINVPDDIPSFPSPGEEFKYRTGISVKDNELSPPNNDFQIFTESTKKLDPKLISNLNYVLTSRGIGYGELRRQLRAFYRRGLVHCYEITCPDHPLEHLLICDTVTTASEIKTTFGSLLNLVSLDDSGGVCRSTANTIRIMAHCNNLTPPRPRATIDRSAAANIMSRHLGIRK